MSNRRTHTHSEIYISSAKGDFVGSKGGDGIRYGAVELNTIWTTHIFTSNTHIRIANMCINKFIIYIGSAWRSFGNIRKKYTNVICLITELSALGSWVKIKKKTFIHFALRSKIYWFNFVFLVFYSFQCLLVLYACVYAFVAFMLVYFFVPWIFSAVIFRLPNSTQNFYFYVRYIVITL